MLLAGMHFIRSNIKIFFVVELLSSLLFSLGCSLDMHTPVDPGNSERVEDLIALHQAEQSAQVFAECQTVLQRPRS